jgi:hypothetical protein
MKAKLIWNELSGLVAACWPSHTASEDRSGRTPRPSRELNPWLALVLLGLLCALIFSVQSF